MRITPNNEYRLYFELLWHTGGSQTDIASLQAEDVDWHTRRLYYERQKLKSSGQGNALESILKNLPTGGPLFPHLHQLKESKRSNYFWTKRVKAGLPDGIVLHSSDMPGLSELSRLACPSERRWRTWVMDPRRFTARIPEPQIG